MTEISHLIQKDEQSTTVPRSHTLLHRSGSGVEAGSLQLAAPELSDGSYMPTREQGQRWATPRSPPGPTSEGGCWCCRQTGPAPRGEGRKTAEGYGSFCHHRYKPGVTSLRRDERNPSHGCWDAEKCSSPWLSWVSLAAGLKI